MSDGAAREDFGFTATGEKVERVTISKGGLTAKVITWGAVIQDLRLEGHQPPLVLGFDKFEITNIPPISAPPPAEMPIASATGSSQSMATTINWN